jgi:signal transduction histidine kinase
MPDRSLAPAELFEHAPCGLVLASPRGEILAVNGTLLDWIGRSRDELVGRVAFSQLLNVAGRIYYETHIAPLLRMQGFVSEIALTLVRADDVTIPVFVSATESHDDAGEPQSVRIAIFQAADRRKYERELLLARHMAEQGMKAKSDFLAVFAHEVRNGLNSVHLAATLLSRQGLPPAAVKPLSTLQMSLDKVLVLLQNMLDLSKVEAGKVELERGRFDIRELLYGVVQTLESAAERKALPIIVAIGKSCPEHLIGDAVKIGQVITNLAGNAVKFTQHGHVKIGAERIKLENQMATVRFSISDTGIGIAPDRISRIWDDFSQAGPEIGPRYGGTGLGLAISRRIVELHGTTIEVESRLGSGTTFWFDLSLPIAEAPMARASAP